jgi:hypothetical protein
MKKNIVITLTLLIALIGGVPGGIECYQYFFSKPAFAAQVHNIFRGHTIEQQLFKRDRVKKSYILITLTISNPGNAKLLPSHFEASATSNFLDGELFNLKPLRITSDFQIELENVTVNDLEKKDLQVYAKSILPGEVMQGHLLFRLDDETHPIVNAVIDKLTLKCVDVFNKEYSVQIDDVTVTEEFLPKHGILPKENT